MAAPLVGTILLKSNDAAKQFVQSWLGFQRQHLLEWGPQDFDKNDGNQRRSDQVPFPSDPQKFCGPSRKRCSNLSCAGASLPLHVQQARLPRAAAWCRSSSAWRTAKQSGVLCGHGLDEGSKAHVDCCGCCVFLLEPWHSGHLCMQHGRRTTSCSQTCQLEKIQRCEQPASCLQVTLNKYALPHLVRQAPDQTQHMSIVPLSHDHFPNYCGGFCGCEGQQKRGADSFMRFENQRGHLMSGRVQCPIHVVADWYTYHFPCTMSTAEKAALLDCYQHLADRTAAVHSSASQH